eukprot:Gregarina_sp_Pseudo_9__5195@NODE_568_length_2567_cov_37_572785_g537_i0_p1_GENE_NODE_568_length_2567_cov_37_572785_g537_i0NODE_568_length_2567_cov_37_572785_g537_i0_p1_ORF_typecomplete_len255_score94_97DUF5601/PF18151_1/0_029Mesd/PF10185_9/0_17Mesd/PF10185_9/2e02Mesd/PF10185_9/3_5e02_NODE_568_length_2567_cov_37_572785_g537_i06131377
MGGVCVKTAKSEETAKPTETGSQARRSVRIALEEGGEKTEKTTSGEAARHSRSAPDIQVKATETQSPQASSRKKVRHSTTTYSVGVDKEVEEHEFQHMLRQFTRKSMSGEQLESPPPSVSRRGPRRDSRIDDRDVLKLIASKSTNPEDKQEILKLEKQGSGNMSLEEAKEVAPDLVQRIQRRRQTMEKLDIFSPDAAPERLEELYEATEKLIAHEDAATVNKQDPDLAKAAPHKPDDAAAKAPSPRKEVALTPQ